VGGKHPVAPFIKTMSTSNEKDRSNLLDSFLQKRIKANAKTARNTGGSVSISIFDLPPGLLVPLEDTTVSFLLCNIDNTTTCNEIAAAAVFRDCSSLTSSFDWLCFEQENTAAAAAVVHAVVDVSADADNTSSGGQSRGLTCRACSLAFATLNEQHAHFKSDLHLLNLR
jgi:hypothetical protein